MALQKNNLTKFQTHKKVWPTKLQILKNKFTKFQTHKSMPNKITDPKK